MKRLLWLLICYYCVATMVSATIVDDPEHSLLWSDFSSVIMVDDFAVVTTTEGMVVLAYDAIRKSYTPVSHLFLDTEPMLQKRNGNFVSVRSTANIIYFVDISNLPTLTLVGEADIGNPFLDWAVFGQDVYIAKGFEGLFRYTMVNFGSLHLADSSNIGIHYTKVDIYGDELFALDDYNGILRYKLSGISFGDLNDMLYLPYQAGCFTKVDTTIAIALLRPQMMLGQWDAAGSSLTDTLDIFFAADRLLALDTLLVTLNANSNIGELVNLKTRDIFQFVLSHRADSLMGGQILMRNSENHIIIPTVDGGLDLYNLDQITVDQTPIPYFSRPGPILDLAMWPGRLATGGQDNPLDIFHMDTDGLPLEQETIYPGMTSVSALHQTDDFLAVMYPQLRHVLVLQKAFLAYPLEGAIFVGETVEDIRIDDQVSDSLIAVYTYYNTHVNGFTISDSGRVRPTFHITAIDRVFGIEVIDSMLFVATGKKKINIYQIDDDFNATYQSSFGLAELASDMNRWRDNLIILSGRDVIVVDPDMIGIQSPTVISIPFTIEGSAVDGDLLAVVGEQGFAIIDMSKSPPRILDTGGRGGHLIAMNDGIVALSNGSVIHIYDTRDIITAVVEDEIRLPDNFVLDQNYPNPFNPATTIGFFLPVRTTVSMDIINILGQRVITLIDGDLPAGNHKVIWLGTDEGGHRVASGVYFYRLRTGELSASKKMLLLK